MSRPWSLGRPLIYSFVVHVGLLMACGLLYRHSRLKFQPVRPIQVSLISPSRRLEPTRQKASQRMVQTESEKKITESNQESYLGAQNQRVDRETVSRNRMVRLGRGSNQSVNDSTVPQLKTLGVALPGQELAIVARRDTPHWETPGFRPEDSLIGIAESDRTALNTREYVYYSYYQRIRGKLEQAWFPIIKTKVEYFYRAGRHLAQDYEHTTRVVVHLSRNGEITRVEVIGTSGTYDLDAAAVAAFNEAGPFPNPPKGMVGNREEIEIPWDFVLKT